MKNAPGRAVLKFGAGEDARPMVPKREKAGGCGCGGIKEGIFMSGIRDKLE